MKREEFHGLMTGLGLRAVADRAFGAWQGWPVSVTRVQVYGTCNLQVEIALDGRADKNHAKTIQQEVKAHKGCSAVIGVKAIVTIQDKSKFGDTADRFRTVMDLVVQGLKEAGAAAPRTCPLCKEGNCDSMVLLAQGYVPVHRTCVENHTHGALERAEQNTLSGNYVTGFIGAIIGGIVGTLPTVILILAAHRIFSLLYALIPICAYYGYKLFRGKMNRAAFVCTLLSSVVGLFSIHFLTNYISLCAALGRGISLAAALRMYIDMVQSGSLTANLVQSGMFLALGLWISWGIITRTSKQEVRQAVTTISTLLPLDTTARES